MNDYFSKSKNRGSHITVSFSYTTFHLKLETCINFKKTKILSVRTIISPMQTKNIIYVISQKWNQCKIKEYSWIFYLKDSLIYCVKRQEEKLISMISDWPLNFPFLLLWKKHRSKNPGVLYLNSIIWMLHALSQQMPTGWSEAADTMEIGSEVLGWQRKEQTINWNTEGKQ